MRLILLLMMMPLFIVLECRSRKKTVETSQPSFRFVMKTLEKKAGNCEREGEACAVVSLRYPLAVNGNSQAVRNINDTILGVLTDNFVFEDRPPLLTEKQLEASAEAFLAEWQTSLEQEDEPSNAGNWEVMVEGAVRMLSSKIAAVSLSTNSYAGGAHPNAYLILLNFNLKTGKLLTWNDVVTDVQKIKVLAEKKFKIARGLNPNANLQQEGFFFDEPFDLPENFELQQNGILLFYNPYEVAGYAAGPTDFVITYEELGDLLRKEVVF